VGAFINKCGIKEKVKHSVIVIPGYAAAISGELEEELGGWSVRGGSEGGKPDSQIPEGLETGLIRKVCRLLETGFLLCLDFQRQVVREGRGFPKRGGSR